jgi:hypothetical protein
MTLLRNVVKCVAVLHKLFLKLKCCKKSAPVGFPVGWVRTPGFVAVWRPGVSLLPGLNYVNARLSARSGQSWDSGVPGVRGPETGSRGRARAVGVGARAVGGAWQCLTSLRSSLLSCLVLYKCIHDTHLYKKLAQLPFYH